MAKKLSTGEILLLAGGAFGLWWYFKNEQPATGVSIPATTTQAAIAMPVPGANTSTAQTLSNNNATLAQQTAIFAWITSWMDAKSQAAFFASWPSMTSTDVSNLMLWQSGAAGGAAWNAWRQHYQIDIGQ